MKENTVCAFNSSVCLFKVCYGDWSHNLLYNWLLSSRGTLYNSTENCLHLGMLCGHDLDSNWPAYILMSGVSNVTPQQN